MNTISETIDSILDQTHANYEIILINDGSTDGTLEVLLAYGSKSDKIVVYDQINKGQAAARNWGIRHAHGEFMVCIDSDDKIDPTFLFECLQQFIINPDALIVYTDLSLFEREFGKFKLDEFRINEFLITNCIPVCAMVRLSDMKAIGGFDENMRTNEDWECWIRLIKTFKGSVIKIDKILYYYRKRISSDSISDLSQTSKILEDSFKYVYEKHYDYYLANGLGVWDLFNVCVDRGTFKSKYYNVWYKKIFYRLFNKRKYQEISKSTLFFRWS